MRSIRVRIEGSDAFFVTEGAELYLSTSSGQKIRF